MSYVVTLSDEQYETLKVAAAARSVTPDELLAAAIATLGEQQRDPLHEPHYYDTEAWFRHLEGPDFVEDESADADA